MENKQYESPEITVISIEPDEKLMENEEVIFGVGASAVS